MMHVTINSESGRPLLRFLAPTNSPVTLITSLEAGLHRYTAIQDGAIVGSVLAP